MSTPKGIKIEYKTFGPHVVKMPEGLELQPNKDATDAELLFNTPIDEAINNYGAGGWELVEVLHGFNQQVPINQPSSLALPGQNKQPQFIVIVGACLLMKRSEIIE
jgi:hypothetical protein